MTFVLMQNIRLPKYRPLSSPLRSGISSFIFLYLLNIRNLSQIITAYSQVYSQVYPHKIWNRLSNVVTLHTETENNRSDCG